VFLLNEFHQEKQHVMQNTSLYNCSVTGHSLHKVQCLAL